MRVVVKFEIVDVHEKYRQIALKALGALEFFGDSILCVAMIVQARQAIANSHVPKLFV